MNELECIMEISEKLDLITNKLDIIIVIAVFAIFIHYTEKWLRIAIDLNDKSGRVK